VEIGGSENGHQRVSGIGALLKNEREKKGLSQEQIVDVIRLRKHYVEALESEDWDMLPAPVFVRGFIRSYAQVLGLNEKEALELYETATPATSSPPKPLVKPAKTKSKRSYLLVLLLVVVGAGLYVLMGFPLTSRVSVSPEQETETASIQQGREDITKSEEPEPSEESAGESEKPEPEAVEEPVVAESKEKPAAETTDAVKKEDKPAEETRPEQAPGAPEVEAAPAIEREPEPAVTTDSLVLTGIVKARTWVRICVDDQEPKEYIFQPGSRPQWKGANGFNILIGNAAGVEFDFNGKNVGSLGEQGKVVRLRFPEDFKGTKCEE
jgi:cytoskeleton protein RodZ